MFLGLMGKASGVAINNSATDSSSSVSLSTGTVSVDSASLAIVKQVWTSNYGTCLASSDSDATCGSVTTTTVATGTQVVFMIFVRNTTGISVSDVRIQDLLAVGAGEYSYVTSSLYYSTTPPADTATSAQIMTATKPAGSGGAGTAESDAIDTGAGNYASRAASQPTAATDRITVGAVAAQPNATLSIAANKTFAVLFKATKN